MLHTSPLATKDCLTVIEEIFGPNGYISRASNGFSYRRGQERMASGVSRALVEARHFIVEAGTGTGKSLAYLIPAVLVAKGRGSRIIISTGTKALQEQIVEKDIPFVRRALDIDFSAISIKGRGNYVCQQRLAEFARQPFLAGVGDSLHFERVKRWAETTISGDRAELKGLPDTLSFWPSIDARSDSCTGKACSLFKQCFITKLKARAEETEIIVVNHHLLLADLAVRAQMPSARVLPDHSAIIIDEAHMLEDIAAEYFGRAVSSIRIREMARDLNEFAKIVLSRTILDLVPKLEANAAHMWGSLPHAESGQARATLDSFDGDRFQSATEAVLLVLGEACESLKTMSEKGITEAQGLRRRATLLFDDLEFILRRGDDYYVYWFEQRGRYIALRATPVDVSYALKKHMFEREGIESVVLTSATLQTSNGFKYIRRRFGMGSGEEMVVESPFNYAEQALMYLPPDMPPPGSGGWRDAAVIEIVKLINITKGRAFVLTTTASGMRALRESVGRKVKYPCLMQGDLGTQELIEQFRSMDNAVLFATGSFWQGVDVRGLGCVIIDRLPFAVPDDPVVAARQKYIEKRGGNAFRDLTLPQAMIALAQGIGRLIRCESDSGLLAILDPRLQTRRYGAMIFHSLPKIPRTTDIGVVARRFAEMRATSAGKPVTR